MMNPKILMVTLIPVAFAMNDKRAPDRSRGFNRTLASLKNLANRFSDVAHSNNLEFRKVDNPNVSERQGINRFGKEHERNIKRRVRRRRKAKIPIPSTNLHELMRSVPKPSISPRSEAGFHLPRSPRSEAAFAAPASPRSAFGSVSSWRSRSDLPPRRLSFQSQAGVALPESPRWGAGSDRSVSKCSSSQSQAKFDPPRRLSFHGNERFVLQENSKPRSDRFRMDERPRFRQNPHARSGFAAVQPQRHSERVRARNDLPPPASASKRKIRNRRRASKERNSSSPERTVLNALTQKKQQIQRDMKVGEQSHSSELSALGWSAEGLNIMEPGSPHYERPKLQQIVGERDYEYDPFDSLDTDAGPAGEQPGRWYPSRR